MTTTNSATNGSTTGTREPDATVDSGRLAANLWMTRDDEVDFDFNVLRVDRTTGAANQLFQSADVADLARLAQLLAAEMSMDMALGQETCDDLACLAACLEDVLPSGHVFPGFRCRNGSPAEKSLSHLLSYLWNDAGRDFMTNPASDHIYRSMVVVDCWMRGIGSSCGIELPDVKPTTIRDYFGGCPICGLNDGYLNIHRGHWFNCRNHQLRWCAGSNLFRSWRSENEGDWNENLQKIGSFREVSPMLNPDDRPEGF